MNTLSCIHTTPAMEGGRMRKVKTIKTCDEVKRTRWLEEHKEELTDIYSRILGNKRLTTKQRVSIERLCDPLDNSINEKISRIRQAFRAVAHDSVANCYIIRGERGEKRSISLNEELIELGEWGRR